MFSVPVTNKTMELADCSGAWFFDETYGVWCLEDILYTPAATAPKFQRLSIYVPAEYMRAPGQIDPLRSHGKYTAATAPVILANNSAGYMQMPHVYLGGPRDNSKQFLDAGYVYVTCGNRGHESRDESGKYVGKAPMNLIDLKTAIRFLRHNRNALPGNMDRIISTGWSAGGAMSTLLGVTGDNENYEELLKENGAFMEESDAVYASQIYCPIIDLEHADLAYEWMFRADKENEESPAGPAGVMTPFQEALSRKLSRAYVSYFNQLHLKHPETGELLTLDPEGRSGSGYDLLMDKLSEAAAVYLKRLEDRREDYTPEEYLEGRYEYLAPAPMGAPDDQEPKSDKMQEFAGPGVALGRQEEATLGDLLSRPPKGAPVPPASEPPMITCHGKEKRDWLTWDGARARVLDLDTYVLRHLRRMKPCTSFDILSGMSGENKVFGTEDRNALHFNSTVAELIGELRDQFPEEYALYFQPYREAVGDEALERRKYLVNPLNFIGTKEVSRQAKHFRVRVGAADAHTSFSVSMTLACKLKEAGLDTDYRLVWDQPHCEADYQGELIRWIEEII